MKTIKLEIFVKEKGKYVKVNDLQIPSPQIVSDMLHFTERKLNGEKIKIKKHYNYYQAMNMDIYFDNYKYSYYEVPCLSGAYIDGNELLKGGE